MATGAYTRVALSTNSDFMYMHFQKTRRGLEVRPAMSVKLINKRHKKLIRSTIGAIFRRKKYHKWPDGAYMIEPSSQISVIALTSQKFEVVGSR